LEPGKARCFIIRGITFDKTKMTMMCKDLGFVWIEEGICEEGKEWICED